MDVSQRHRVAREAVASHAAGTEFRLEIDVRTTDEVWGLVDDPGDLFGPHASLVPTVQWFDGDGFADLLRTQSPYRRLDQNVREPLLDAIAERIRTRMGDRASRVKSVG